MGPDGLNSAAGRIAFASYQPARFSLLEKTARARWGRLRKVAKWTLIVNGSLLGLLIVLVLIVPSDDEQAEPISEVAADTPLPEPLGSKWVHPSANRGPKATEWAKPGDPDYREAEPAPVRTPVPTPAATTSGVIPNPLSDLPFGRPNSERRQSIRKDC